MKQFFHFPPLSEQTREQPLYVISTGSMLVPPHQIYPLAFYRVSSVCWKDGRTINEYQLTYIARGGGSFESASHAKHPLQAGDLFMLFPGEWHRYMPDLSSGWEEYWISFHGPLAESLLANYPFNRKEPILRTASTNSLVDEYLHIAEEMGRAEIGHERVVAARTLLLLSNATALSLRKNLEGTDTMRIVDMAKSLMSEEANMMIGMEELADRLGMGYSWFRREFRAYTGFSPGQYFLQLRLNRAKNLLNSTTLSVAEIGRRCGFDSAFNFSNLFKKKIGQTPSKYRGRSQGD